MLADVLSAIEEALHTAAGLLWRAAWALALGYAVSAAAQVFVSRRQAATYLGDGTPRQLGLAAVLGLASSSCSVAALAATRSLWTEGAALTMWVLARRERAERQQREGAPA